VLLSDASPDRIAGWARALESAGFEVVTCDPTQAPTDADRILARRMETEGGRIFLFDGADRRHECAPGSIMLIQRGARITVSTHTLKSQERVFSMGRAIMSGGILLSKTVDKSTTTATESRESFLLIQRCDGQPDFVLYERRMDYRFLGKEMESSSHKNFGHALTLLQTLAPAAPVDHRVSQAGFVSGLPATSADPVDLALYLVVLAHLRSWSPRQSST
jgi:hypothetical protein